MRRFDMLAAMDRFVHAARLDLFAPEGRPRPRNLRWLPLLALAAMVAGYAVMVAEFHPGGHSLQLGFGGVILFILGYFCACLVRLFGPRLADAARPLDEREQLVRARAGNISFFIITVLAMLGCFYGGYAAVFGTWMPRAAIEWVYLGLFFQAAAMALPVWVASWLQPKPDPEDE
jgi:hypothetical protein